MARGKLVDLTEIIIVGKGALIAGDETRVLALGVHREISLHADVRDADAQERGQVGAGKTGRSAAGLVEQAGLTHPVGAQLIGDIIAGIGRVDVVKRIAERQGDGQGRWRQVRGVEIVQLDVRRGAEAGGAGGPRRIVGAQDQREGERHRGRGRGGAVEQAQRRARHVEVEGARAGDRSGGQHRNAAADVSPDLGEVGVGRGADDGGVVPVGIGAAAVAGEQAHLAIDGVGREIDIRLQSDVRRRETIQAGDVQRAGREGLGAVVVDGAEIVVPAGADESGRGTAEGIVEGQRGDDGDQQVEGDGRDGVVAVPGADADDGGTVLARRGGDDQGAIGAGGRGGADGGGDGRSAECRCRARVGAERDGEAGAGGSDDGVRAVEGAWPARCHAGDDHGVAGRETVGGGDGRGVGQPRGGRDSSHIRVGAQRVGETRAAGRRDGDRAVEPVRSNAGDDHLLTDGEIIRGGDRGGVVGPRSGGDGVDAAQDELGGGSREQGRVGGRDDRGGDGQCSRSGLEVAHGEVDDRRRSVHRNGEIADGRNRGAIVVEIHGDGERLLDGAERGDNPRRGGQRQRDGGGRWPLVVADARSAAEAGGIGVQGRREGNRAVGAGAAEGNAGDQGGVAGNRGEGVGDAADIIDGERDRRRGGVFAECLVGHDRDRGGIDGEDATAQGGGSQRLQARAVGEVDHRHVRHALAEHAPGAAAVRGNIDADLGGQVNLAARGAEGRRRIDHHRVSLGRAPRTGDGAEVDAAVGGSEHMLSGDASAASGGSSIHGEHDVGVGRIDGDALDGACGGHGGEARRCSRGERPVAAMIGRGPDFAVVVADVVSPVIGGRDGRRAGQPRDARWLSDRVKSHAGGGVEKRA